MKNSFKKSIILIFILLNILVTSSFAQQKKNFTLSWTVYVGNMPLLYAAENGILDKWAKKYGINIKLVQVNDYIEQINQYTAGQFDAALMTNMDTLTIPSAGGVDTTIIAIQDFSNGNDGIILKNKKSVKDLKNQKINLVQFSVSHYLLARALASVGLSERDLKVVNTSDSDIVSAFSSDDVNAVVTWNPQLTTITQQKNANVVFDSSDIPGEIIDSIVVNTKILKDNPNFAKALTAAWYEAANIINNKNKKALEYIAEKSETDLKGINQQLSATKLFYNPKEDLKFIRSDKLVSTMKKIAKFSFDHGILGEGAPSPEFIGIEFPNNKFYGDKSNVKMRFDDTYIKMAADGKL